MSIGKNIKRLRLSHNLSQEEFGKITGVTNKAVSTWENEIKNPRMGVIQKIADYFGIKKSDIIEDDTDRSFIDSDDNEPSNISDIYTDLYRIPLYESASAGFGVTANSDIIDYIPLYIKSPSEAAQTLAIKVNGNSMYPKIEDGDTIVVHKQDSVDSGSIAVVILDEEDGLVKRIKYGRDWIDLESINPEYQTRHFEDEEVLRIRIVGLVKQVIKSI